MRDETVTKNNFHFRTKAIFQYKCHNLDQLMLELGSPNHKSETASIYWYLEDSVIRWSDHWGKVKDCKWSKSKEMKFYNSTSKTQNGFIAGYCLFADFIRIP